jgi:hypothetical protein
MRTDFPPFGHAFTSRRLIEKSDGLFLPKVKHRPLTVSRASSAAAGPKAGRKPDDGIEQGGNAALPYLGGTDTLY